MEFLFENDWLTARWNSISKQLIDCTMEFLLWSADLLCDGISFLINKTVQWNSFLKQLNGCVIKFILWTTNLLFDGIAFSKKQGYMCDGIPFANNWLAVWWKLFSIQLPDCAMEFLLKNNWVLVRMEFLFKKNWQNMWLNSFCEQPTYCSTELLFKRNNADCAIEFLFENNLLPVSRNSFYKQLTDCAMLFFFEQLTSYLIELHYNKEKGWLWDGFHWKIYMTDKLSNQFFSRNNWLTLW